MSLVVELLCSVWLGLERCITLDLQVRDNFISNGISAATFSQDQVNFLLYTFDSSMLTMFREYLKVP